MAPDKDQGEDNAESDSISYNWWEELEENDPENTRILRKLRSERKAVVRRIGGKLTSDEKIVTTSREMRLQRLAPFFQGNRGRRLRAKLLVAIAKCETLKEFDSSDLMHLHLQPKEWEGLLKRMNRNCQLEKIVLGLDVVPAASSRHVGELVKGASNLKTFEVSGSSDPSKFNEQGIAERFPLELAAIASSLQGHKHPTLTELVAWPVNDLTNDVVKIISSAPHLSDLELVGPCSMDETTKVVLCAALKECADLKRVYLRNSSEGILEVLAKVYGQRFSDPQVSVLESLTLEYPRGLAGLAFLASSNISNLAENQVSVLESLTLEYPRGLAGLACLASSNISNLEIQLGNSGEHHCSLEEWQRVGRSLVRHPTLRVFKIQIIVYNREEVIIHSIQLGKELAELWKASRKSPLLDIRVKILTRLFDKDVVFLQDALKDTYLKEIDLSGVNNSPQVFKSFAEMVGANTSVRSLRLLFQGVDGTEMSPTVLEDFWGHLFHHLRENTSIRILALTYSKGLNEENFRDLMDLLQVNFILRDVKLKHTQWERDGKSALVQAALERNAKLAGYFSVLGAAQLSFDGAKAGRIFLCGLPFAGKTQLKVTMMECLGKTSRSESLTWSKIKETVVRWVPALRRTEGIEVELFYDKEAMTISIWDFAGQQIFRPLQNILFPKISQACVFLFVFNPFNKVDEKIIGLKENVHDAFADELRSWIRFIVSNTQITGRIRPQVIVVITHKDKLENRDMRLLSLPELEKIVKKLQREFEEVVELCPEGSGKEGKLVYHINATLKQDLEPIKNLVISSMKDVLSKKSPKIPRVCSELVSHLLKRPTDIQSKPLWPCEELYEFCSSNSELLSHIDVTEKDKGKVLHAIASYMHDAGAVCMTPRALMGHVGNSDDGSNSVYDSDGSDDGSNSVYDLDGSDDGSSPVYDSDGGSNSGYDSNGPDDDSDNSDTDCKKLAVVDLNWLTQKLLGQLITIGHSTQVIQDGVHADGLLNTQQLEGVLDGVLSLQGDKDVDSQMVKELLLELDLCYCLERVTETKAKTNRYFFMPMLFGEESTVSTSEQVYQPLSWVVKMPQGSGYFGYRIQCRDTDRTSLSPAFYPRFQIHLRKRMGATLGVNDNNFIFARSHVDIRVDGYSIFVETDKSSENHVDVLVNFCKTKTRDQAVEFVWSHIVKRLFKFCASEKGCPGVELVVGVIRSKCVENLTPRVLRTASQTVLLEELKTQIKQRGYSYRHYWPVITTQNAPKFDLDAEFELAVSLLSPKEMKEIAQSVRVRHQNLILQEVPEANDGPCQQLLSTSEDGRRICDELYEVYVPDSGDVKIELVFIHGLQNEGTQKDVYLSTWTVRNDQSNCWLMSWLPNHIPDCRILSVSYDASTVKTSTEGRMDMYLTVENLVMSLVKFGEIGQKCPVILVGHCLGGLVAITVCNKMHWLASLSDPIPYRNFCRNLKGLFFYSIPFSGVKLSDLGAPRGVTFWGFKGGEAGDLMENLELFDKRTARRNHDFAQLKKIYGWKTQCVAESCNTVFEGLASSSKELFVDEGSARAPFMDDVNVISDTDHFSVCRPKDETSNNFQLLVHFVQGLSSATSEN